MAVALKTYIARVNGLRFQLVENWCLCKWCQLFNPECENFAHWITELKACIDNLKFVDIKNGIDKYKLLLDEYNRALEQLREKGKLPTPQEIINSKRQNKNIDLISMIEQLDKHPVEQSSENSILSSAIQATEEQTRTGMINEQVRNIKQLTKAKDEITKEVEIE